jgi:hypothetical protein
MDQLSQLDSMAASGFPSENLGQLSLSQLRDIASRLGIGRLSRGLKRQLLLAMQSQGSSPEAEPLRDLGLSSAAAASGPAPGGEAPRSGAGEAPQLPGLGAELPPSPSSQGETRVVFLPRDPQWAYVFWEISSADRESALAAGAGSLVLRLEDVTGRQDGHAHPHTLQEVVVDAGAHEWYLPVPLSDRDYRVELGFRRTGGGWISLALSGVARMPAQGPSGIVADRFIPFSLEEGVTSIPVAEGPPSPALGLHERLYQQASGAHRRLGHGSEGFLQQRHDEGAAAAGQRSGVGLWASGRNDSGAGLAARQRSFWLVADAELIVYGATEPSALLRIGEEVVPLSSDGTFKVQVPFRDGEQIYPISAVAADGVQKRSITLGFSRTTPEANVNSSEDAVGEWF